MELQQYVAIVRRRLLLVIVAIGVAVLGGYAATRGQPATYTATTKLQAQQFVDTGLIYHMDLYGSQNLALNDAALATAYPILQQAAARDPTISGGADGLETAEFARQNARRPAGSGTPAGTPVSPAGSETPSDKGSWDAGAE